MNNSLKLETLCVQGGWQPKKGEPRVLPIYQSTTFKYDTSEQMAKLFDLEESGYFYTRLQNPTNDAVAAKIAALGGADVDDRGKTPLPAAIESALRELGCGHISPKVTPYIHGNMNL